MPGLPQAPGKQRGHYRAERPVVSPVETLLSELIGALYDSMVVSSIKAFGPVAQAIPSLALTPGVPAPLFKNQESGPIAVYVRLENSEGSEPGILYAQISNGTTAVKGSADLVGIGYLSEITCVMQEGQELWVNCSAPNAGQATWNVMGHYKILHNKQASIYKQG